MIDINQFRKYVVDPVMHVLDLYSAAASNLLVGTAYKESGLRSLVQTPTGPALGVYQMEPATFDDIYKNFLAFKPKLLKAVNGFCILEPSSEQMIGNLYYATAMARVHYYRVAEALPDAFDHRALAAYWKKHYNTPEGKGSEAQAASYFRTAVTGETYRA